MTDTLTAPVPPATVTSPETASVLFSLRTEALALREQIKELRLQAGRLTAEAASRHDWCGMAQDAVDEAGCIWPEPVDFEATVTATFTIKTRLAPPTDPDDVSTGTFWDALTFTPSALEQCIDVTAFSDWQDSTTTLDGVEVTHISHTG